MTLARRLRRLAALSVVTGLIASCASIGKLSIAPAPVEAGKTATSGRSENATRGAIVAVGPMFGDTTIGLVPGTADSARRYLGRLRTGYTFDTLNVFLLGDNRPGNRSSRLGPEFITLQQGLSLNPLKILKGLVIIPVILVKGLIPDLALVRDIPGRVTHMPTWGPERTIVRAMLTKADSIRDAGGTVAAVINTGDLVNDGRRPAHWSRFLEINRPLTSRIPYFAVAGNHERTDDSNGVANWRTATGLPVGGDRLYYCFDSADGWVRFIALDSNPFVDPANLWSREVHEKYSEEQITWMIARLKEHQGPAFVFMHHPPFSSGFHHNEWQADSILTNRRARMMRALHETGISVLATGHEHTYQRALFEWPDAVLVVVVTGGGGAPLHAIPPPAETAREFAAYKVAGSTVKPGNVVSGSFNNFAHVRLWFGGGELLTYAVDKNSKMTLADNVRIDFTRFGIPKIDAHKMAVVTTGPVITMPHEEGLKTLSPAKSDSVARSARILAKPSPKDASKSKAKLAVARRDSVASARRDSLAAVKRDSVAVPPRVPASGGAGTQRQRP
jgi:hypothetical protein